MSKERAPRITPSKVQAMQAAGSQETVGDGGETMGIYELAFACLVWQRYNIDMSAETSLRTPRTSNP